MPSATHANAFRGIKRIFSDCPLLGNKALRSHLSEMATFHPRGLRSGVGERIGDNARIDDVQEIVTPMNCG
jgi:hypothetical protein